MRMLAQLFIHSLIASGIPFISGQINATGHILGHSNNWAVLVCTSRYWFNYRHVSNTLSMYYIIRKMGIPDSQIILMNAMDSSCDARNPYPGKMFNTLEMDTVLNKLKQQDDKNFEDHDVEVDYRGDEVNVDSFMRVLTGRHIDGTPASKILQSSSDSNILIFLSGHGGDEFLKFRDIEEISSQDLGFAFEEMESKKRYNEILLIVDTCQASTLGNSINSPRIITIGSSGKGENSYAYESVPELGIAVIDRFSFLVSNFFYTKAGIVSGNLVNQIATKKKSNTDIKLNNQKLSTLTLKNLMDHMDSQFLHSTVSISQTENSRDTKDILLTDFFGQKKPPTRVWGVKNENSSKINQASTFDNYWDSAFHEKSTDDEISIFENTVDVPRTIIEDSSGNAAFFPSNFYDDFDSSSYPRKKANNKPSDSPIPSLLFVFLLISLFGILFDFFQ